MDEQIKTHTHCVFKVKAVQFVLSVQQVMCKGSRHAQRQVNSAVNASICRGRTDK